MSVRVDPSDDGDVVITFRLPAGEPAGTVSVVGSFNDWEVGRDEFRLDGAPAFRSVHVQVPNGSVLHFRCLAEGGRWFDEAEADEIDVTGSVVVAAPSGAGDSAGKTGATPMSRGRAAMTKNAPTPRSRKNRA